MTRTGRDAAGSGAKRGPGHGRHDDGMDTTATECQRGDRRRLRITSQRDTLGASI